MQSFIKKHLFTLVGISLGALAGFLYWKFVGCASGSCSITSVWYNSTAYGAIMGGLLLNIFKS
jgi:hypothetical protein